MKILHTSDWHLGIDFHKQPLLDYQEQVLLDLVEQAREQQVDAILVAGDVYDRTIPPVSAVRLLDKILGLLTEIAPVVLISGNHDNADRLGFGSALMRENLQIFTSPSQVGQAVELPARDGRLGALIYPVPYLAPALVREDLATWRGRPDRAATRAGEAATPWRLPSSHGAVFGAALRRIGQDLGQRYTQAPEDTRRALKILLAHAFLAGGAQSDSERDIRVGGIQYVPTELFADLASSLPPEQGPGLDYLALGHLHRPQQVAPNETQPGAGLPPAFYCGTPLPYSFSETGQVKHSLLISTPACPALASTDAAQPEAGEAEPGPEPVFSNERLQVRELNLAQPYRLERLRGTFAQIQAGEFAAHRDKWVEFTLDDAVWPTKAFEKIQGYLPGLISLLAGSLERSSLEGRARAQRELSRFDATLAFWQQVTTEEASGTDLEILQQVFALTQSPAGQGQERSGHED